MLGMEALVTKPQDCRDSRKASGISAPAFHWVTCLLWDDLNGRLELYQACYRRRSRTLVTKAEKSASVRSARKRWSRSRSGGDGGLYGVSRKYRATERL